MAAHKKILMVSEALPARQLGGLGKHVVTLANALIEQGHDVVLMGLAGIDDEACRKELGYGGQFLGALDFMRGWKEGPLGCFNPYKRPYFAHRMAQSVMAHADRFDVVHYHGHLPLVAAYIPEEVNFVQTRHDQGSECLVHVRFRNNDVCRAAEPAACASCASQTPNALQKVVSAAAVRRYRSKTALAFERHKTVFVSEAIRRNARRVLPESAFVRSWVVHNFIDQQRVANEVQGLSPPDQGPVHVSIASRIDAAKGVAQFLEAWMQVRPERVHLTVAGDGPLRPELQSRWGAAEGLTFLGHQPYDHTLRLTAKSHVAVVPSVWEEPCATTILEALFIGRPCFALRRGGTPELKVYERWPGQLHLFDSMGELVKGVVGYAHSVATMPDADASAALPSTSSGVLAQLPRLLDVYEAP